MKTKFIRVGAIILVFVLTLSMFGCSGNSLSEKQKSTLLNKVNRYLDGTTYYLYMDGESIKREDTFRFFNDHLEVSPRFMSSLMSDFDDGETTSWDYTSWEIIDEETVNLHLAYSADNDAYTETITIRLNGRNLQLSGKFSFYGYVADREFLTDLPY